MAKSNKLNGANDMEKLKDLANKTYKEQAVWYLNSFWEEGADKNAEAAWRYVDKIVALDLQKGASGNEVDELQMHRFLEFFQETMTVREMRDTLRAKGAIGDAFRMIGLIHYLTFRYNVDFHVLVNAPQGDNREEIEEAQRKLDAVQTALQESEKKAQAAKAALANAKAREADAKAREAEAKARETEAKTREADAKARESLAKQAEAQAKTREAEANTRSEEAKKRESEAQSTTEVAKTRVAEAKAAQGELEAALREVKAQEDAFNKITEDLTRKSNEGTVVSQNKAKNELAQHLASDPLPLRKAKITQEAAVKKADRATKAATEAKTAAEAAAAQATKARAAAEDAARQAEAARKQAEEAARQAEAARHQAEEAARQAEAARKQAEAARHQAEEARRASEQANREAEAAVDEAQKRFAEAEAFLAEVKSRPGKSHGAIWWMERELHEKKKFIPTSKGGITK